MAKRKARSSPKKQRANDRIANAGKAIVDTIVNLDLGWIYRPQDASGTDYGIDGHIEVTDDDGVETGRLLAAQIKTGASYFANETDAGFLFRGELRHLSYWLSNSLPVLVILVNEQTRKAHWALVHEPIERSKKGWKLVVPREQLLDASSKAALSAIAFGAGTERTRAKNDESERQGELERKIAEVDALIAEYVGCLTAQPAQSSTTPSTVRIDILKLSFPDLLAWVERADLAREAVDATNRTAYVLAAEYLFFQTTIAEHDAAKALTLLLLAEEWGKAGSIFLYALDLAQQLPQVASPSIIDLFASTSLPESISRDLRIVLRSTQIAARRKHVRAVDALLVDLDELVAEATLDDAWAVTVAAFGEARATGRRSPLRAINYIRVAATLRPGALGYGNLPFPESVDQAWPLMLELTAGGVTTDDELDAWLAALALVPEDARARIIADEMNGITLANRFWLDESRKPAHEREWARIHRILTRIEEWSTVHNAPLLFAAARRGRVVIRGEYEHNLRDAITLATDAPSFVQADAHAMFLLNEIAASQFLYAGQKMESFVTFRSALAYRPRNSWVLLTTLLKAAQAAAAVGEFDHAVRWTSEAIEVTDASDLRASTDRAVARAENALTLWFAGDRIAAAEAWDGATEELFAAEDNTARWCGLAVRFHYVGGYIANTLRNGTPPTVDADGKPYVEPRPGAFLIDLASQAPAYSDEVRFAVLLIVTMMSIERAADDRAKRWVDTALRFATEHIPERRSLLALPALPYLVDDARYVDALELARTMATGWEAHNVMPRADGELVACSLSIVPSVLAIARTNEDDPAAALHDAESLANACRAAAETSNNGVWANCAELLHATFISDARREERLAVIRSISAAAPNTATESPIMMLTELCASVVKGVSVETSLALHARALAGFEAPLSRISAMYRLHVVPFFSWYWKRRVMNEPSAFMNSAAIISALNEIGNLPEGKRPRAILATVAAAIRLS